MQIILPSVIETGAGASARLGGVLKQLGLSRPLVVTDAFVRSSGLAAGALSSLDSNGFAHSVFADVLPDPSTDIVGQVVDLLKDGSFDCLVAVGGGSPIDTAKAASVLNAYGGHARDYKAPFVATKSGLPVIAIPTTAGTGSEATKVTVITDSETGEKMLMMGPAYMPTAAITDFELTLKKPMRLTADTGIDSLTHAIEAYVSRKANPFTDGIAQLAMASIYRNLETACKDPNNLPAREAMMLGATLGGMAFSNASVALVHGMSRPLGAYFHVPHGLSNAMLLPAITAFSLSAALERYADCSRFMGVADGEDTDAVAGDKLVEALSALTDRLEVPSMSTFGIAEDAYRELIPTMTQDAIASGSPANNPRVGDEAEIADLYEQVYS